MRLADEILITEEQIAARVREMAAEITADTEPGSMLSVLAILDGAFIFCSDLIRRVDAPLRVGLLRMISITRGGDVDQLRFPADFPITGTDLLVVEDILDTGHTLAALSDRLMQQAPARLRTAVLLDKPAGREVEFKPDYVGFTIPDHWVVGYGLDSGGLYRNLPHITYVK